MSRALQLAQKGLYTTHPNPRVGCVLVKDHQILAEGWHQIAGQGHAEVNALRAAENIVSGAVRGATAYVSLEPCSHFGKTPPCAAALIKAGVGRVVSAMEDPNPQVSGKGHRLLLEAGIEVSCGLLEEQARALNPGFIKRMQQGVPWVWCKSAMSVDGRTAMANGESQWITGPDARQDVQRLRARCEAIITGVDTVLADKPSYTVRPESWPPDEWPAGVVPVQPIRVVLDSHLRIPLDSPLLTAGLNRGSTHSDTVQNSSKASAPVWVVCVKADVEKKQRLEALGVTVIEMPDTAKQRIDLPGLLRKLASADVNEVLVEAGATVTGAFIEADLVDEWRLYMAPCLMGSAARPLAHLPDISTMAAKKQLELKDIRQVGNDIRLTYRFGKR